MPLEALFLRVLAKINLLSRLFPPVVQLYPIPPDGDLGLCPGDSRPLWSAQRHPDHQAAAVAQLVRVPIIVEQEEDSSVPELGMMYMIV